MARQRRGGGFKPPELRGTLGTLFRTAAAQVGPLRDALERTAREGRSRLEDARSSRRRTEALAELGEIVLGLIRKGEIDAGELPEVRDIVAHLDEIDAGHPVEDDRDIAPPPARNRFDSRRRDEADGAVSSRAWPPPTAKPVTRTEPRVWRPPVDDPGEPVGAFDRAFDEDTSLQRPTPPRRDPLRQGGISFEDDDDLAEYMHPDDVPAKKPGDADS